MNRSILPVALVTLVLSILLSCSDSPVQVSGGSGSETVVGVLVDTAGLGVDDARVRLYRYQEIPGAESQRAVDSTSTDTGGRFVFEDVAAGSYQIDALNDELGLYAFIPGVAVEESTVVTLPARTMARPSSLSGWVAPQPPLEVAVVVARSPYVAVADSQGSYSFASLPAGTHTVVALVRNPTVPSRVIVLDTQAVTIETGQASAADSVRHTPLGSGQPIVLLDNIDDCDEYNALGGYWWPLDDKDLGGTTVVTPAAGEDLPVAPGRGGTGCALRIAYTFGAGTQTWYPRAGIGAHFGKMLGIRRAVDLTNARRLTFWAKGAANNLWVTLESTLDAGGAYCEGELGALSDTGWTQYAVDLDTSIVDPGSPDPVESWPVLRRFVTRLTIRTLDGDGSGGSGEIWVDDLEFHYN